MGSALVGVTTPDDGLTAPTLAAMTRCGVDLLGIDQLVPDDGRTAPGWSRVRACGCQRLAGAPTSGPCTPYLAVGWKHSGCWGVSPT